jgi:uncharacterized protein with NRDE domain
LAAVTNFHSLQDKGKKYLMSRGEIITNFVNSTSSSLEFSQELKTRKDEYSGFSVFLFDGKNLVCCSNRDPGPFTRELPEGVYGLSNHLLDTPWPKVEKAKQALTKVTRNMKHESLATVLLNNLGDATLVVDKSFLPTTLDEEEERIRSSVFVQGLTYGTRTTTIVTFDDRRGFHVTEKNHETPFDKASWSQEKVKLVG